MSRHYTPTKWLTQRIGSMSLVSEYQNTAGELASVENSAGVVTDALNQVPLQATESILRSLRRLGAGCPGRGRRDGIGDILDERRWDVMPHPSEEAKLRSRYARRHIAAGIDRHHGVVFAVDDHGRDLNVLELRASVLVRGVERCCRLPLHA